MTKREVILFLLFMLCGASIVYAIATNNIF